MERNGDSARVDTTETIIDEWAMDTEQDDEMVAAADVLAGLEASLEDAEPWQRLGDILGRITGIVDLD